MASPGAIASTALQHHVWNPRKSDFFPLFDAEIVLEKSFIKPFKPITGKLVLSTSQQIKFHGGIRVQLDANIRLRFSTKVDNRATTNWAMESIFKDCPDPDEGSYVASPYMMQLMGDDDLEQPCQMEPGEYSYDFTLPSLQGEPLPAPFRSQYGTLQYYVAAYMGSPCCYVQMAEKHMAFAGFLNLMQVPTALESICVTSHLFESIFSSKAMATFTLLADKAGYHPGEQVPFVLAIDNPKGKHVKSVKVSLVRKAQYKAQGAVKTTSMVLDTFEAKEGRKSGSTSPAPSSPTTKTPRTPTTPGTPAVIGNTTETGMSFMGIVTVPKPCIPTYAGKAVYSLTYFLQYEVVVKEHPAVGKGQAEIIIGTTKPSSVMMIDRIQSRRPSALCPTKEDQLQVEEGGKVRPRSHSVCARSGPRPTSLGAHLPFHDHDILSNPSHHHRTLSFMTVREFDDTTSS